MAGHVDAPERLDMTLWTIPILATVVAHGNGLDDNQDGSMPPTPGVRRLQSRSAS